LGPPGACYQEWNNLGVRAMLAEIRDRLARNIIFTTIVASLLTTKYDWFSRLRLCQFTPATKIHCRRISRFYRSPI